MAKYDTLLVRLHTLKDPRDKDHVVYTLPEVLFIVYASILSDYSKWEDMESFAKHNAEWFRHYFPYRFGFPSHSERHILFNHLSVEKNHEPPFSTSMANAIDRNR